MSFRHLTSERNKLAFVSYDKNIAMNNSCDGKNLQALAIQKIKDKVLVCSYQVKVQTRCAF